MIMICMICLNVCGDQEAQEQSMHRCWTVLGIVQGVRHHFCLLWHVILTAMEEHLV